VTERVTTLLGALLLLLWVIGVAGWLGTGLAANWAFFLVGIALVALGRAAEPFVRRRSSAPARDRP